MSRRILFELRVPDGRVARVDLLLQQGEEPGEMCQHQRPLLRRHFVLLCSELVEELLSHSLKHRLEKRPKENIYSSYDFGVAVITFQK